MAGNQNRSGNGLSRRTLLKLIASGVAGYALDADQLLWLPNRSRIFVPTAPKILTNRLVRVPFESQIAALEMERLLPKIKDLFERDDRFYSRIIAADDISRKVSIGIDMAWQSHDNGDIPSSDDSG